MAVTISGTSGVTTPGLSSSNSVNITSGSGVFPDSTSQSTAFVGGRGAVAFYGSAAGTGMVWNSNGSATFTVPTGITAVKVTVIGGGGPGQGGSASAALVTGNGGAGAGVAIRWITGLTPGATVAVTIGAGGVGNTSTGTAGGTSSFGAYATATGGSYNTPGAGSSGNINLTGGASGPAAGENSCSAFYACGGAGGGAGGQKGFNFASGTGSLSYGNTTGGAGYLGGQGAGMSVIISPSGVTNGNSATSGYGNGGSGCAGYSGTGSGGNGTPGIVIVEW